MPRENPDHRMLRSIVETLQRVDRKLDHVLRLVTVDLQMGVVMSKELDQLTVQVKANTDAEAGAVVMLGKLSELIKASVNDPAALTKLATDLDASKQALAAAVLANTPADPAILPPGAQPIRQTKKP